MASGVVSAFVQIRGCLKNFPTFLHSGGFCVKKRLAIRKFPAFFALRFPDVCKQLSNSSIFKQALKKTPGTSRFRCFICYSSQRTFIF